MVLKYGGSTISLGMHIVGFPAAIPGAMCWREHGQLRRTRSFVANHIIAIATSFLRIVSYNARHER
jgi:hypothetical protein